jgi:hypothetical protein
MITKQEFSAYEKIKDQIEGYAADVAIFIRDNDLRQVNSFKGTIESIEIGSTDVCVMFSEAWSHGGYDSYSINFPTKNLLLTLKEIGDVLQETNSIILKNKEQNKKRADSALLKQQKEQYEKLKKHFEK